MTLDDLLHAVEALAADETEPGVILACLRTLGHDPDDTVLADAVELVRARDGLLDGSSDPYRYLECEPRAGVNVRDAALARCEDDLRWCLEALARPRRVVAS